MGPARTEGRTAPGAPGAPGVAPLLTLTGVPTHIGAYPILLGVDLDDDGYVRIDPMKRETSVPGIYASGDLTTRMQGAVLGAASGTQAAAMLNVELTMELASTGAL